MSTKRCRVCGEEKAHGEFYADHRAADGLRSKCKRCHNAQTIEADRKRRPQPLSFATRFATYIHVAESGCWEWTGARSAAGYGMIQTGRRSAAGNSSPDYAHRVSYEMHVGPIPGGLTIDHLCRNRACVNPAHLEPVTGAENTSRASSGEGNANAKLAANDVAEIRASYAAGTANQYQLAARYGVAQATVGAIVRGETWRRGNGGA